MIHKSNSTEVCDQSMRTFRFHLDYTSRKSTRLHAHNVFLAGRMYIGQLWTHLKSAVESGCRWLTDDALHGFERRKETCETHIVTSLPNSGNFVSRLKASHLRRLKWDLKISSWRKLKLFLYFLPFSFPLYLFFCTPTATKKNKQQQHKTKYNDQLAAIIHTCNLSKIKQKCMSRVSAKMSFLSRLGNKIPPTRQSASTSISSVSPWCIIYPYDIQTDWNTILIY